MIAPSGLTPGEPTYVRDRQWQTQRRSDYDQVGLYELPRDRGEWLCRRLPPLRDKRLPLSRIAPSGNQQLPLHNALIKIEFQEPRGCFSLGRERFDQCSPQHKMTIPKMTSRIEETYKLAALRITRANIAPLPRIASKAGEGEIG